MSPRGELRFAKDHQPCCMRSEEINSAVSLGRVVTYSQLNNDASLGADTAETLAAAKLAHDVKRRRFSQTPTVIQTIRADSVRN